MNSMIQFAAILSVISLCSATEVDRRPAALLAVSKPLPHPITIPHPFPFPHPTKPTFHHTLKGLPPVNSRCPTHVFHAVDNTATLYINGVPKTTTSDWNRFGTTLTALRRGDVISIRAKDLGVWYGAIASFYHDGRYVSTGIDDWRAVKARHARGWQLPTYNACKWPRAKLLPGTGTWNAGKSPHFPYATGARYVWAADAGERDEVYLRHRIGGEGGCNAVVLRYAADDAATVYVNGKPASAHTHWPTFASVRRVLRNGDVVAIVARDIGRGWYGVIADMTIPGVGRVVTGSGAWKARQVEEGTGHAYVGAEASSCGWEKAEVRPGAGTWVPGKAKPFPYEGGAKYVWAKGKPFGTVVLRYVVGGEVCGC